MPTREYYQRQADVLFAMVEARADRDVAAKLIERAKQYLVLADAVAPPWRGPIVPQAGHRQQQQQQQQKKQAGES